MTFTELLVKIVSSLSYLALLIVMGPIVWEVVMEQTEPLIQRVAIGFLSLVVFGVVGVVMVGLWSLN